MIDVEQDIFNDLAEIVYTLYPQAYVTSEHVEKPASFPAVSIIETINSTEEKRLDTSGEENAASLTYTVDVYSNSEHTAKQQCKSIMQILDDRMRFFNMTRVFSRPLDNAVDPSIYRMTARYTGLIDKDHVHYRR